MKTLIIILWFLIAFPSYAQTTYNIVLDVERVAINHSTPTTYDRIKVLLVLEGKYFGISTGYDTLYLKKVEQPYHDKSVIYIYEDELHNKQRYYIMRVHSDTGFAVFIIPMKPYNIKRLWSLNLSNIN